MLDKLKARYKEKTETRGIVVLVLEIREEQFQR